MSNRDFSEKTCEELSAYLDGELPDDEARRVEHALRDDAELARELAQLRAMRALVRAVPREKAPDDFVARVLAQAERSHLVRAHPEAQSPGVLRWARHFATAAMLVISLGIGGVIVYTLWNTHQMPGTPISMSPEYGDKGLKEDVSGGLEKGARKDADKLKEIGDKADGTHGKVGGGPGGARAKGGEPAKAKGYAEYDDSNLVAVDQVTVNVNNPDKDVSAFAQVLDYNNFKRMDDGKAVAGGGGLGMANTQNVLNSQQNTLARNTLPPQGFYYVEQLNNDQVALVVNGVQDGREAHNLKEGLNNKIQEQRVSQPRHNWDEVAQLDIRNQAAKKDQKEIDQKQVTQAESLDEVLQDAMKKRGEELAKNLGKTRGSDMSRTAPAIAKAPSSPAAGPAPSPSEEDKYKHEGQKATDMPAAKPTAGGKLGPDNKPEGWAGDVQHATTKPAESGAPIPGRERPPMPASQPAVGEQEMQRQYAGQGQAQMKQNMRAVVIVLNRAFDAEAAKPTASTAASAPASQSSK